MSAESSELVQMMNGVARILEGASDLEQTLTAVAEAGRAVPGVEQVSLTLVHNGDEFETARSTDPRVLEADQLQYELCEGPCFDTIRTGLTSWTNDLGADDRWPMYAPKAVNLGYISQMSLRLFSDHATLGSLNLYSPQLGSFDERAREIAELVVTRSAAAMSAATAVQTLSSALTTRTSIGTALGIVMERYGLDQEGAFQFLVRMSQTGNTKLRLVAERLVESSNAQSHRNDAEPSEKDKRPEAKRDGGSGR